MKATLARRVPSAGALLSGGHEVDLATDAFMPAIKKIADAYERLGLFP